jgi:hypothetical protein
MPGPISRFLSADHDRLEDLLSEATAVPGEIERSSYEAFRSGLLRHIGIEEKILAAAYRKAGPPDPDFEATARLLRIDHGAIAALLVPSPTHELVREIRSILRPHNGMEEGELGFYARCDARLAAEADAIVARMRAYPQVPTMPHNDGPAAKRTAAEALAVSARQFEKR